MTVTKVYCDRCSELITSDRTLLAVKTGPERCKRTEIDLCSDCLAAVVALIDERPAGCTAPSPRRKAAPPAKHPAAVAR